MDKFKRQERYIVVKLTDLAGCSGDICPSTGMSEAEIALRNHLESWHVPTRHCLVVERDWPEYEPVWRMIEDRVSRAVRVRQGGGGVMGRFMAECPHCDEMFDDEDGWFEHVSCCEEQGSTESSQDIYCEHDDDEQEQPQ